jgi:hypothetical protein
MRPVGYYCTDISRLSVNRTLKASIDLFRPCIKLSSKAFQVTFINSPYNSALFFPSCCCPFLLHVVAYLICIFLGYRQLLLLSALTKFLHSFNVKKKAHSAVLLKKFISIAVNRFLFFNLRVQIFAPMLTHWNTQPAVRRPSHRCFAVNSSILSVDGTTCLIPFES